ncbi:MAG: FG-GAP-like repeat-containing protein [Kiritimatiellaeota bacterium]|nr:FG-GAP-like repeat-containing protein [Kiritimatiellota bacterium]
MNAQHIFASRFLALAGFCLAFLFAYNSYAGGQVIAWGYNLHDQCDVPAEALSGVTNIAGGETYSLALKDGKVIAWGASDYVPAEALSGVSAIACRTLHNLALKDGKVIAWGTNADGQCDVPAEALSGVSAIACGALQSLALKDGKVIVWGTNNYGQCNVPAEALSNVSAIACGEIQSLALKDGKVIAWGATNYVPAEALSGVSAIACGGYHNLALKDGKVIAWGYNNDYGQCDVPAEALSGVSAIAGGRYYSLALKNGKVIAWGYDLHNQCDVPVLGQNGVVAIAAGDWHILALKAKPLKVYNDFDGDCKTDLAIYYPASGQWWVYLSGSRVFTNVITWGSENCLPAPGDYDGDGKTDFMVFDSTTGNWYGKLSGGMEGEANFGQPGTWPVPADYDGDRVTDLGVYDPFTGVWSIYSLSNGFGSCTWGHLGYIGPWDSSHTYTILPMPFDYNQDGVDDLCYYYRGQSMEDSGWSIFYVGIGGQYYTWGSTGSLPAPGKYSEQSDESAYTDGLCVYKITTTTWCIPYRTAFNEGVYGKTLPVPAGDYDGNGFDDNTVYNYVTGEWTIIYNTGPVDVDGRTQVSGFFGGPTAVPANIYSTIYALARYSPKPW